MKKYCLSLLLLLCFTIINGQVAINSTGAVPDPSAILDVSSTSKGFLPPVVNSTSDISSPATGLLVFQTNSPKGYYCYNGSVWAYLSEVNGNELWSVTGNTGLTSSACLGTTDNTPLNFRVNNYNSGRIDNTYKSTFFGYKCGNNTTTGYGNTAMGSEALKVIDSSYNTAIGRLVLKSCTGGKFNTALGTSSQYSNVKGCNNVSIGPSSLRSNKYSSYNVAVGNSALLSLSYQNGQNVFASDNVAVGYNALYLLQPSSDTNGCKNTGLGEHAMHQITRGRHNTSSGYYSLYNITTGNENTAVGNEALYSLQTGSKNTAAGYRALYSLTSGTGNTAIGTEAGEWGTAITTGSYNTFIGYHASSDDANRYNCIAIAGYGNLAFSGDNNVRVGNNTMKSIGGEVEWSSLSDKRIKKITAEYQDGLSFVLRLQPVTYNVNLQKENELTGGELPENGNGKHFSERHSGFLAQDVLELQQELGFISDIVDIPQNKKGLFGLRYALFTIPLIKAVQQQQETIEKQKTLISDLEKKIETLKEIEKEIDNLEKLINNK